MVSSLELLFVYLSSAGLLIKRLRGLGFRAAEAFPFVSVPGMIHLVQDFLPPRLRSWSLGFIRGFWVFGLYDFKLP